MSAIDKLNRLVDRLAVLDEQISPLKEEADKIRAEVKFAREVLAEYKAEMKSDEQEAFSTLCVQSVDGGVNPDDLVSYASIRELEHPDANREIEPLKVAT